MWAHRAAVTLMVLAAVGIAADMIPEFALLPPDVANRFQATYLNLVLAAYAGILALFVVWRVGDRPEGQALGLLLGVMAITLSLVVAPSGEASPIRRALFIVAMTGAFQQTLRFWTSFPQKMERSAVHALASRRRGRGSLWGINPLSARVVATMLRSHAAKVVYVLAAAAFSYEMSAPGSYAYAMFLRTAPPGTEVLLSAVGLPAVLVTVAFAWTAYRLADSAQQKRVLWIIFATLTLGVWVSIGVMLGALEALTDSRIIGAAARAVTTSYHPVTTTVTLTGFAIAMFYAGAFDLRPLINKTTVYGAAFVVLTTVFAGVEELVQSQLAARLGISEGFGTWLGAGAVAVAMGPVQKHLQRVVKNLGVALDLGSKPEAGDAEAT